MENNFKITNMVFDYSANPMMVNVNFNATFDSGNTVAGKAGLTIDEFNSNTGGLVGFATLIKEKLVADFNNLEEASK